MADQSQAGDCGIELTEKELQQEWKKELDAEQAEGGLTRQAVVVKQPREGWVLWSGNKIWVENRTDCNIVVYVHRFHTIGEVVELGAKAAAGATQASVDSQLKWARREGLVQIEPMSATDTDMRKFTLGSGSGGAYVTAALADDPGKLFCKDRHVKKGRRITLSGGTFTDNTLGSTATP